MAGASDYKMMSNHHQYLVPVALGYIFVILTDIPVLWSSLAMMVILHMAGQL